ncbi:hypothetical protein BABINDRAFT_55964 [Babjeviella inositovora NRRL Y-12698]|uniref:Phosphate transporter n=1 Tax=Babjeviella inositovora NRRL Y-12698 TaxID=984486 RepID=A0A1E3QXI2_9ASCO|nr:uncharacterized protein BABINDRAFT_55964 [Babjeviella inositovora NRRL Y-12698]ODQ82373.1 hypothetical protein BABINDRAFT_55964 [Babjeviella inositovora NRRL Y-12698]
MQLQQFDYIFAIAVIFAFLDAWNIGANDVANSFASSVSSRALKYWQAMILAAICEFLGAVLAGSRVADTIRNKIMNIEKFEEDPAVLMLAMACALVGSSTWLTIATSIGMPVSTTHSIVGASIGAGIASIGGKNIHWGWNGVSQIIASWFIAPCIAGGFASIIFLISKFGVLERKHAVRNGLWFAPCLVYLTFSILTMLIVWKGAPNLKLNKLSGQTIISSIFGVGAVATTLYMIFVFPVMQRKLIHEDWTLKWYDVFRGPIYYFKSIDSIPPMPEGHLLVIDYYKGRRGITETTEAATSEDSLAVRETSNVNAPAKLDTEPKMSTRQLWWYLFKQGPSQWGHLGWLMLKHGWDQDIINSQLSEKDALSGDLAGMHSRSKFYDNKLEHLFSLLQAITACTMSFAHGSNDIANAAGPLSTVYTVWKTNTAGSKADVPIWVLCFTAGSLVLGCWTYGYRIMKNLGNKLILQSPSRGFAIELGAAITTVMATQLGIPVSTTQSAVGATVFVGLCNKDFKAVNWRMVIWCYLGWLVTLPCAGLVAGILMGIVLNAPHFGGVYTLL